MSEEAERRVELGRFLRAKRERLDPVTAGFPAIGRRRTAGLRREEVAVLAGVSTTWYTYLEQGRNNNVSPAVLNSVARVLQLTDDETRYMHFLASGQMSDEVLPEATISLIDLLVKVVATAERHPYPVYMVDHRCDLIAWNPATTEWYDDWTSMPPASRNFMYWLFTSPRAREAIVDWADFARDITARWRLEAARFPSDRELGKRVTMLIETDTEFTQFWEQYSISEHHVNSRWLRHPHLGDKCMIIAPLRMPYTHVTGIIYHL